MLGHCWHLLLGYFSFVSSANIFVWCQILPYILATMICKNIDFHSNMLLSHAHINVNKPTIFEHSLMLSLKCSVTVWQRKWQVLVSDCVTWELANRRDGADGLQHILSDKSMGKVRVTASRKVLDRVITHFEKQSAQIQNLS